MRALHFPDCIPSSLSSLLLPALLPAPSLPFSSKIGSHYVAQGGLKLTIYPRLTLNSRSSSLSPRSAATLAPLSYVFLVQICFLFGGGGTFPSVIVPDAHSCLDLPRYFPLSVLRFRLHFKGLPLVTYSFHVLKASLLPRIRNMTHRGHLTQRRLLPRTWTMGRTECAP